MSKNVLFEINTTMDKEDYRKFSYLTIFRRKYFTVAMIILLAAVASFLASFADEVFEIQEFLLLWLLLIVTAFGAICLRVEYKGFKRMNMVKVGLVSVQQDLFFYENYLTAEDDKGNESKKIKYDRLHQVLESQDYFIIYANASSASVIRKKDIDAEVRDDFKTFLRVKLDNRFKQV